MSRARLNTHQFNVKQTDAEWNKLQAVNEKLFDGKLNNTDLGRFLLKVALDTLEESKVETKQIAQTQVKINGKVFDVERSE